MLCSLCVYELPVAMFKNQCYLHAQMLKADFIRVARHQKGSLLNAFPQLYVINQHASILCDPLLLPQETVLPPA